MLRPTGARLGAGLPDGVVGNLRWDRQRRDRFAAESGAIKCRELLEEDSQRPFITNDVMHHNDERGRPTMRAHDADTKERRLIDPERLFYLLRDVRLDVGIIPINHSQRKRDRRPDLLNRRALDGWEAGT